MALAMLKSTIEQRNAQVAQHQQEQAVAQQQLAQARSACDERDGHEDERA